MKAQKLVLIVLFLVTLGCGKGEESESGPCMSDYTGDWSRTDVDATLTLTSACVFKFASEAADCQSQGTYPAPLGESGTVAITINSTSGSGCLPVGEYACSYGISGDSLALNCGAGTVTYER